MYKRQLPPRSIRITHERLGFTPVGTRNVRDFQVTLMQRLINEPIISEDNIRTSMPPKHIIAIGGLVTDTKDRILMILSPRGDWEFPGGQVEEGEDLIAALKREVLEETGVTVEVGSLVGIYPNLQARILNLDFLCRAVAGSPTPGTESIRVEWVDRQEATSRILRPVIRDRMRNMLEFCGTVNYRSYSFEANALHAAYAIHVERTL
jgi:8-oxo-dGTP diphosphatase